MPRKDIVTGVMVATDGEFWQMMADMDDQGKTPGETMNDMYDRFDRSISEEILEEQRPEQMLMRLQNWVLEWMKYDHEDRCKYPHCYPEPYEIDPFPVEILILEYSNFKLKRTFREFSLSYNFKALCDDGQERSGRYWAFQYHGDFYNPPDYEEFIEWENS